MSTSTERSLRMVWRVWAAAVRSSGESVQMAFGGQGWVLVQPSEGRVGVQPASGGGGGLGNLLGG